MADSKISGLPVGDPIAADDLFAVDQEVSEGVYQTIQVPFSEISSAVADALVIEDLWVDTTGDTMTGALNFEHPEGSLYWSLVANSDNSFSFEGETRNQVISLNSGTAAAGNTGQLITGRFRYNTPIVVQNTAATVSSGASGVTTSLIRSSNASPMTITIRDNVGDSSDFHAGAFFSVMQEGAGQITIAGENGDVVLRIPTGYIAATRDQYSVISATLYDITGAVQTWVISGDLAEAA